jgi:hypothetical protein
MRTETDPLAVLNRLNIARLTEIMVIFTQFIKYVEGKLLPHFDFVKMLQMVS